jgi:hypothetical protein
MTTDTDSSGGDRFLFEGRRLKKSDTNGHGQEGRKVYNVEWNAIGDFSDKSSLVQL